MKKIYLLRLSTGFLVAFACGAMSTGYVPTWLKVVLCAGVFGRELVAIELFDELKKPAGEAD